MSWLIVSICRSLRCVVRISINDKLFSVVESRIFEQIDHVNCTNCILLFTYILIFDKIQENQECYKNTMRNRTSGKMYHSIIFYFEK